MGKPQLLFIVSKYKSIKLTTILYPAVYKDFGPPLNIIERTDGWYLEVSLDKNRIYAQARKITTTDLLGTVEVIGLPYVLSNEKPYKINTEKENVVAQTQLCSVIDLVQ